MVHEPTVEDTISILRGIKEKYEIHHGIRISDSAVIAAAVYLGYSLPSNNWGQSWIIWVVAGVIFPAVIAITSAFEKKSK